MQRAGATVLGAFRGSVAVERKGRGDFVTDADRRVEAEAISALQREYPDFGVVGEESGGGPGLAAGGYVWIIDPIDGTANFARGIPHFATTVALLGPDGAPVVGATFDPVGGDFFSTAAGGGAFVNGGRIRAGRLETLSEGVLGMDLPYGDALVEASFRMVEALLPVQRVRVLGSGALGMAYTAAGWLDLHVHLSLRPWDVAAGLLLVREAGGEVLDARGQAAGPESGSFVSGNAALLREFLERTAGLGL